MTEIQKLNERRLLDFHANTHDPRWSSHSLSELIANTLAHGGGMSNIVKPLFFMMAPDRLSVELAHFIKDVATTTFVMCRSANSKSDLGWMNNSIESGCSEARAYLALYTLPAELISPQCIVTILKALADTPFWPEAVANLQDEAANEQVRKLLNDWLAMGVDANYRADVKRLASVV